MKGKNIMFILIVSFFIITGTVYSSAQDYCVDDNLNLFNNDSSFDMMMRTAVQSDKVYAKLTNSYGESYIVTVFETPACINRFNISNGEDEYSKTYLISLEEQYMRASSGNDYREAWDGFNLVKAYSTIYFNIKDITPDEYLLTKVAGGWTVNTPVQLSNRSVSYICEGRFPTVVTDQHATKSPTTNSYSYNTGFTKYVIDDSVSLLGARSEVNLKYNSADWSLTLINNLLD